MDPETGAGVEAGGGAEEQAASMLGSAVVDTPNIAAKRMNSRRLRALWSIRFFRSSVSLLIASHLSLRVVIVCDTRETATAM